VVVSFSMMFSGRVKRDAKGPSALSISLRFLVSVLFIAVLSGSNVERSFLSSLFGLVLMLLGAVTVKVDGGFLIPTALPRGISLAVL